MFRLTTSGPVVSQWIGLTPRKPLTGMTITFPELYLKTR